ncbi:hypothetical protein C8R44DRAFT_871536 [Mycena epipterygia]|nr:hypothetical protein C8R44DRAFT_871536 [Mycena epipterygia]
MPAVTSKTSTRLPPILLISPLLPGANAASLSATLYHVLRRRRWPNTSLSWTDTSTNELVPRSPLNTCRNHRLHPTVPTSPQLVAPPHSEAPLVAFHNSSRPQRRSAPQPASASTRRACLCACGAALSLADATSHDDYAPSNSF